MTVRPPLDPQDRFPRDGVAFRMLVIDGGPAGNLTVADSRFPVLLSTFTAPRRSAFPIRDYTERDVPAERTRSIDADGEHYEALAFVGPHASPQLRAVLGRIVASLAFRRPQVGTIVGEQTVLRPADAYPVLSFTLVHARAEICNGSVRSCRAGSAPFYLVHAPGVLHQPDLIDPVHSDRRGMQPAGRVLCDRVVERGHPRRLQVRLRSPAGPQTRAVLLHQLRRPMGPGGAGNPPAGGRALR